MRGGYSSPDSEPLSSVLSPLSAEMVFFFLEKHVGCLDTVKTQLLPAFCYGQTPTHPDFCV